jgi:hypothetical protein
MNKKISFFGSLLLIAVVLLLLLTNCDKTTRYEVEKEKLNKIYTSTVKPKIELNKEVHLYIDYSKCMRDAVDNSTFFQSIRARLTTGIRPTLFAIKGTNIEQITTDGDLINQQLNLLDEVSAANIRQAAEDITNGNNQAILITDGEYWTNEIGERLDFPYMLEPFKRWVNKGFSIHFIVEDYTERHKGRPFNKKRFYIFFTDDKIENNVYQEISKDVNLDQFGLKKFKLTNSDLKLRKNTIINANLSFEIDTTSDYDICEIFDSWEDIYEFIIFGKDDEGNIIPSGYPLIENISLSKEMENYIIEDIDLKAYNISEVYLDSVQNNALISEIKDGILIDKELFKKDGSISIHLNDKIEKYLFKKNECENLLRIDIIINNARLKPAVAELFSWNAMLRPGVNVSVFESVKQTLDNQDVNLAKQNNGIIYTIFIKTPEYK